MIPTGPADQTPPEPAVAVAIGRKLGDLTTSIAELSEANKLLTQRLDTIAGTIARAVWEKLEATFAQQLDEERAARVDGDKKLRVAFNAALLLARRDAKADATANARRIDEVDHRVDELSLKIGVSLRERDSKGELLQEEVTKVTKLAKKTDEQVAVFTRGRVGFGLASAALALAAKSDATWASVKLWLWSHGLVLTVAALIAVVAIGVEVTARLRARKGPPK